MGSLHPDNVALIPQPGTSIELLLVSRSHKPTVESALLENNQYDEDHKWELFWVMYVVWQDGIAERKGVGQILESALENAVDGKPTVKNVLLG